MEAALWRDVPPTHVQVAGIAVRDNAIAALALLLSEAGNSTLATYVGQTWDRCRSEMSLNERDCADILAVLEPIPPDDLEPFIRGAARSHRRNTILYRAPISSRRRLISWSCDSRRQ